MDCQEEWTSSTPQVERTDAWNWQPHNGGVSSQQNRGLFWWCPLELLDTVLLPDACGNSKKNKNVNLRWVVQSPVTPLHFNLRLSLLICTMGMILSTSIRSSGGKAGSRGSPACVTDVLTHKVSDSLLPSTLTDLRLMRKRIISQQILIKPGE